MVLKKIKTSLKKHIMIDNSRSYLIFIQYVHNEKNKFRTNYGRCKSKILVL